MDCQIYNLLCIHNKDWKSITFQSVLNTCNTSINMEVILGDLDFELRTFLQFSAHVPIVCGLSTKILQFNDWICGNKGLSLGTTQRKTPYTHRVSKPEFPSWILSHYGIVANVHACFICIYAKNNSIQRIRGVGIYCAILYEERNADFLDTSIIQNKMIGHVNQKEVQIF